MPSGSSGAVLHTELCPCFWVPPMSPPGLPYTAAQHQLSPLPLMLFLLQASEVSKCCCPVCSLEFPAARSIHSCLTHTDSLRGPGKLRLVDCGLGARCHSVVPSCCRTFSKPPAKTFGCTFFRRQPLKDFSVTQHSLTQETFVTKTPGFTLGIPYFFVLSQLHIALLSGCSQVSAL